MSAIGAPGQDASSPVGPSPRKPGFLNIPIVKNILPFIIGGGSGCVAITCVQPIDVVKTRLQLAGEGTKGKPAVSPLAVGRAIVADGKVIDLWAGLSAGLFRQMTYATMRLGFFDRFLTFFATRAKERGSVVGFGDRAMASLSAGGLAAGIATPAEVALIRMQSDGMKPKAERANYRSVFDALIRVSRAEGIRGLWSGSYPTIIRAMSTNFGQLAFFSESKSLMQKHTQLSFQSQSLIASSIAGFFAAVFSLPFDLVKTRLQRGAKKGAAPEYKGMVDCALQVLRREGPLAFYTGFGPYFLRIAPHSVITLIVADNVHAMVKTMQDASTPVVR